MSRGYLAYFVPSAHRRLNEFIGLLLATTAILVALSLISFNADDPSFNISRNPQFDGKPSNFIGVMGSYVADGFFQMLGYSSFLLPIFLGFYAFYWLASWPVKNVFVRFTGMALMAATFATALSLSTLLPQIGGQVSAGGLVGQILADNLDAAMNPAGSIVVLIAAFLVSLFLCTTFSFSWSLSVLKPRVGFISAWADRYSGWRERNARETARLQSEAKKAPKSQIIMTPKPATPVGAAPPRAKSPAPASITPHQPAAPQTASSNVPASTDTKGKGKQLPYPADFPPTSLLLPPIAPARVNEDELRQRALMLEQKTREFDVEGVVQQIHPGPVVTTFEFKPEPGVKYARITGLGDDLCLALEAESVRIDRIPGKSTVGIEVPNDQRATITLRELLEAPEYAQSNYRLPLALGKDITGKIVVSDLQKMPHLLSAGSTGTGKSVSINTMILSLLFRCRPDQMKMILIDPKRLELGLYQDIPHLMVPVVTEPQIAQNALRWAVSEMEGRYKKLAKRGVRNLEAYNDQVKQLPIPGLGADNLDEVDREPLPYIVIVIDELADLMMTSAREVEECITRLAQMARAVGIHLILATQRPSVDVITGLIKANFPARMSFRVASKVDSRTILDSNGAEQLLGRGDMLFLPPGSSRLMRVHGALVTEEEVFRVVEFLKKQGKPSYNEKILESPEESRETNEGDGELDELYDDAVRIVIDMGKASTSALQRRLRVGYGRAASLLDAMEHAGLIGPPDGSKARAVLVTREEFFGKAKMGFKTDAIHAGQEPDPTTGAVSVPIYQTSTYVQEGLGKHKGFEYARTQNPTRFALEQNMTVLEGGVAGYAFASGMAATTAVTQLLLKQNDHAVCSDNVYGGTFRLFDKIVKHYGVEFTYANTSDLGALEKAIRPNTRMVFVETPTNPLMAITDIPAVCDLAHRGDCRVVVDNTFMSPYFQRPLGLGADIVVHSTTKYLNGHSDSVGGIVVLNRKDDAERLQFIQNAAGAILSPFDSFLVLRGIKTLPVRMEAHNMNGMAMAHYLSGKTQAKKIYYPGLPSHPGHALAKKQMSGFGAMIAFDLDGLENAKKFLGRVRLCSLAESLGGVETLISHPATMTHASVPADHRAKLGITDGLVRISVGIEDIEDLIADLENAFAAI